MKRLLLALVVFSALPACAESPWKLMGTAQLFLGQYYYQRSAGSLNGYADANFQLARSFSTDSGIYFSEHATYSGFKQVNELAGGGTLFQQSLDNSLGVKWVKRFENGYSLKPRLGLRSELFRETTDESWGKGLYDSWRYEAGLTWERRTRLGLSIPWTYQLSYDLYYTHYPRFRSLASQFGSALSAPDPGQYVLDAVTHQLTYRSDFDFPNFMSAYGLYSLALSDYGDQKVVGSQGQYLNSTRSDAFHTVAVGGSKRLTDLESLGRIRPVVGTGLSFSSLMSNQNNFDTDTSRLKFISGYYNYNEVHLSPSLSATFLAHMLNLRAGYDFGYRMYSGRLAQTVDGNYTTSRLRQWSHTVSFDAGYPLVAGLDLKARVLWSSSNANTAYEQVYKYRYESFNYFGGVEWRL